jgi:site-specific recombinase XerD
MSTAWWYTAANDTEFAATRHRTLPITASLTPIANYPSKLRIFRTNASRFWQVRCYFKGKTYTQSLRTTNKQSAISLAKQFFHIKTAELYGETVCKQDDTVKFADIVQATLAQQLARAERGEITREGVQIFRNRLHKTILPFFGNLPLKHITYAQLCDFVSVLSNRKLTADTLQKHLVAVRRVFNYAHSTNLIAAVPKFPTIKITAKPRGHFDVGEYRRLVRTARSLIGHTADLHTVAQLKRGRIRQADNLVITSELAGLIRFVVNSFIRPSDIKHLQHRHVTIVRHSHTYLRLNLPESKRHSQPIVTLSAAVPVYEHLLAKQQSLGLGADDDYLFLPQLKERKLALELLGWQFRYLLKCAQIGANSANGKSRTLYSLRHSAITFRLLYGRNVDLLTLARNARTSVKMVERFYSSNLSAEMNIAQLQG